MKVGRYILIAVLLLTLMVVFFAPSVNLEPSALRAVRQAAIFFFAIFVASHCLISRISSLFFLLLFRQFSKVEIENTGFYSEPSLIDLNCSRLC